VITKKFLIAGAIVLTAGLVFLYRSFNPALYSAFPRCPFKTFTGYQCPGCGSQRAVHHLLNGDIQGAFDMNALLVISIPYLVLGYIFENSRLSERGLRVRKFLYGKQAIWIITVVVIVFGVARNVISAG
jgi:hypothetical protein